MFKNRNLQSFGSTPEAQRLGLIDFLEKVEASKYFTQELSSEALAEIAEATEDWPGAVFLKLWSIMGECPNAYDNTLNFHRTLVKYSQLQQLTDAIADPKLAPWDKRPPKKFKKGDLIAFNDPGYFTQKYTVETHTWVGTHGCDENLYSSGHWEIKGVPYFENPPLQWEITDAKDATLERQWDERWKATQKTGSWGVDPLGAEERWELATPEATAKNIFKKKKLEPEETEQHVKKVMELADLELPLLDAYNAQKKEQNNV